MLGIDIIEVERIEKSMQNQAFLNRTFSQQEIDYCNNYMNKCAHFAGFFCAKEAVMKALEDCKQISFKEIEILHYATGKPYAKLYGKALEVYKNKNCKSIEISISQTNAYATAVCLIK